MDHRLSCKTQNSLTSRKEHRRKNFKILGDWQGVLRLDTESVIHKWKNTHKTSLKWKTGALQKTLL